MLFHSCKDSSIWLEWTSSHQCTSSGWGCSSRFGGWTQTHPSRAFLFSFSPAQGFFSHLLCPKVFPSYLPTPSPPKPKFIFSPLGLASFFSPPSPKLWGKLRNIETQGSLGKWWRKGVWSFNPMADAWAEGKLSPSPSFLKFQSFFFCCEEDDDKYHRLLLLIVWEEEDDGILAIIFFFPYFAAKRMTTTIVVFFFSMFEKKKTMAFLSSSFFFLALLQKGWQQLPSSLSSHCLRKRRWHSCHHFFFTLLCHKEDNNNCCCHFLLIVWSMTKGESTIKYTQKVVHEVVIVFLHINAKKKSQNLFNLCQTIVVLNIQFIVCFI